MVCCTMSVGIRALLLLIGKYGFLADQEWPNFIDKTAIARYLFQILIYEQTLIKKGRLTCYVVEYDLLIANTTGFGFAIYYITAIIINCYNYTY